MAPQGDDSFFRVDALLKADVFGRVERGIWCGGGGGEIAAGEAVLRRDAGAARWWARPLARWLARREARALAHLAPLDGVPRVVARRGPRSYRSWIDGAPMQVARPREPAYYRRARRLVARLHRARVVHNDLAKEPNWLVTPAGEPAVVDFQLAMVFRRRTAWFRSLAREDLRHLLKHKRTYCPEHLTERERRILATPAATSRWWRATGKRVYLFVTRRLLGWADREGAGDRGAVPPA